MKIPINEKPYLNVEKLGNPGVAEFIDCYRDDGMNNVARPGLGGPTNDYFVDIGGSEVQNIFEWRYKNWMVAVDSSGNIWKIDSNRVKTQITGDTLTGGRIPQFTENGDKAYLANGGKIIEWDSSGTTCAFLTDPDAPLSVTHLAMIDSRLVAKSGETFFVSEAGDPTDWQGIGYTPEVKPDKLIALAADFEEITLFSESSLEFWSGTGKASDPYERLSGTTTEHGTTAPYSIDEFDNSYWFLDFMRRVVRINIRNPQVVSNPFDSEFQSLDNVSDCRGFVLPKDTLYVQTYPSEDKTYAYDYKRDVWSRWSYLHNGTRERFLGQCGCFMSKWNEQFVGSRKSGKIYICSRDYTSDGGSELIPLIRTGSLNFGSQAFKYVNGPNGMLLKVKRGQVANPSLEPTLNVRYKKENNEWSQQKTINLGRGGEMDTVGKVRPIGRFRTIEFEFSWDASSLTALMSAELNI